MRGRRIGLLAAIIAVLLLALVGSNTGFADTASSTPNVGAYDSNYVYQQIVDHKLPIAPDGKPTSFSWGRYYTGPNGLEFRLNNDATWSVISKTFEADIVVGVGVATGSPGTMGDLVLDRISSPLLKGALTIAGIIVNDPITTTVRPLLLQKNLCLGITIPPKAVPTALDRAAALARGQTILATQGPYYNDTKIWLEKCSPGYESKDVVAAPPAPPPAPDTQPAVKAAPIVAAPKSQPVPVQTPAPVSPAPVIQAPPSPVIAPPAPDPGPVYKDVSMDQICHDNYGGDYHSEYQDPNNYDSWHCVNDSGYSPGGMDVESYCPNTYPGSYAVHEPDGQIPAYWWKCRIG